MLTYNLSQVLKAATVTPVAEPWETNSAVRALLLFEKDIGTFQL